MAEDGTRLSSVEAVFSLLEGTWQGEGMGEYPTIDSFPYRETLVFERPDATTLFYIQRTQRPRGGSGPYVNSHWESGFIHALEGGGLQLTNVQIGGRGEVLHGRIEQNRGTARLVFESESLSNDARMVRTARFFEFDGDTLRYEMEMATTRVPDLTFHVAATLKRSPGS